MKISERVRKWWIPALAGLLVFPCLSLMRSQAAGRIDIDADCSLTVSVARIAEVEGNEGYAEDFEAMKIPVAVYQVADVDATGREYTPKEAFGAMDFGKVKNDPQAVTADDWRTYAKEAETLLPASLEADGNTVVEKTPESTQAAEGTIEGLKPGLYLVVPEAVYNPAYTCQYTFEPYLTALPGSEYTSGTGSSDEWQYHTEVGLKPEAVPLYGNLTIRKTLNTYNAALGRATFVFRVTGTDEAGGLRYEDYVSMDYQTGGTQTVTVEQIPAGLDVTVTEVYSGASYEVEGSDVAGALIWSQEAVAARAEGAAEASVSFVNTYNGGNRGGYGVTNHFEADGQNGWTWENPTTPLPSE